MSQTSCVENLDLGSGDETSSVGSASTLNENRSDTPMLAVAKGKRGRKSRKKKPPSSSSNAPYKYTCHIKEDHQSELFGIQFNNHLRDDEPKIFATVGSNRATVYECLKDGGLKVLMVFADPSPSEVLYSCAWSYNDKNESILAAAGYFGVIRVINTMIGKVVSDLIGHGAAVNEVQFHPKDPALLLSASKDHTLRLWNIRSHVCIAILGIVEGHRDEVLSADFSCLGDKIMSCGMDHSLKLWRLDTPEVKAKIEDSFNYHPRLMKGPFLTHHMNFPDFSTRDVHKNYVDCVRWYADVVLSKSCDNRIMCWKPGRLEDKTLRVNETKWTLLHTFDYTLCEIWFIRFCLDLNNKILALGNATGKIFMWQLDDTDPAQSAYYELCHFKCTVAIRQISISRDGSVLLAACGDSTVWRWDRIKNECQPDR